MSFEPPPEQGTAFSRQAAALARVARLVSGRAGKDDIIDGIVEEAADLFSADCASVFLFNDRKMLRYVTGFGLSDSFIDQAEQILGTDAAGRYLSQFTAPVAVILGGGDGDKEDKDDEDAHQYSPVARPLHRLAVSEGLAAIVLLPLIYEGQPMGCLTLYHGTLRPYSREDLNVLAAVGGFMSLFLAAGRVAEARREEIRQQDRFFGLLSHELRTPLTSIVGFAQLIKKKLANTPVTDRKLLEHAEMLWAQAQRLSRLIDTFVDLAYIERGEFALNPGKADIVSLLKGAAVQARELARGNPLIELDLPAHSLWVHADSRRLERVFIHILLNAIQHSPEGQPVKVVCRHDSMGGKVLIRVTDRGPGIPPARLHSIFDRSGRQEVPGSGGLGIGLYISKAIVEAHGGQISIDSSPKQGTSVSISLPA